MRKILINGRFLCRQPTGVERFATELLQIIDRWYANKSPEVDGIDCEILIPALPLMHWQPSHIPVTKVRPLRGHAWEQIMLARRQRYDALVSLCNTGPVLAANHVVAIHDATPMRVPESFSRAFRSIYRGLMPLLGRTAARVITVSDFSAREIQACYGISGDKIDVVENSGEHVLRVAADNSIISQLSLQEKPFALAVAANARHKNISILSTVAERLRLDNIAIVLVGSANNKVFDQFSGESADTIIRAGFVSDSELRALYEHAACFVFPSFYEGFGIPPLEAMQLGCPVLSSNSAALPEVLGDAALYVAPTDANGFSSAIKHLVEDEELRDSLSQLGYACAAKYSWATSARRLLAICLEVASKARLT